jgi:hypothetical protein
MLDFDVVMDHAMSAAKVKIALLDASRDNPFASKLRQSPRPLGGLADMSSLDNSVILFATSPGEVATDGAPGERSPFTQALLDHFTTPGVEIGVAMQRVRADVMTKTERRQIPWSVTNLTGFFYMNPVADSQRRGDAQPEADPDRPPVINPVVRSDEVEIEFWRSIKDSRKVEEFSAYLRRHPNGIFAAVARARVAELLQARRQAPLFESSAEIEAMLGLAPAKRREIQERLSRLGFYNGEPTGDFDDATRDAIKRWQADRSYPASGYLNEMQVVVLLASRRGVDGRWLDDRLMPPRVPRQPLQFRF